MQLFFQTKNGKEYSFEGDAWKPVKEAYAVKLLNAVFKEDLQAVEGYTGVVGEEENIRLIWPIMLLARDLAAKRTAKALEEEIAYYPVWKKNLREKWLKQRKGEILYYLNGENPALWETWKGVEVFPFYAKGNRIGWFVEVRNELEAAAAETVLPYIHGWKVPFRVCVNHLHFYYGKECPLCLPGKKLKADFLNLLRVHKSRETKVNEARMEIDTIRKRVNTRGLSVGVLKEYKKICENYGLPTKKVENLLKIFQR
ncbi:MAG: hypothetical protein AB1374_02950 [Bacillota bacterium]